jgi:hypothetical protein
MFVADVESKMEMLEYKILTNPQENYGQTFHGEVESASRGVTI